VNAGRAAGAQFGLEARVRAAVLGTAEEIRADDVPPPPAPGPGPGRDLGRSLRRRAGYRRPGVTTTGGSAPLELSGP
jgi:hypothetical protein